MLDLTRQVSKDTPQSTIDLNNNSVEENVLSVTETRDEDIDVNNNIIKENKCDISSSDIIYTAPVIKSIARTSTIKKVS